MLCRVTWMAAVALLAARCTSVEDPWLPDVDGDASPPDLPQDLEADPADVPPEEASADIPVDLPVDVPETVDVPEEPSSGVVPPLGGSSGGSGGAAPLSGAPQSAGGISYNLIVPAGYSPSVPAPLLVIFSGTEGGDTMTSNMLSVAPYVGMDDVIIAVLDGVTYYDRGDAGEPVIDDVRARYNIDNDRTYLLSESAGTGAGLQLGFQLRESYFAAFWANDVNTSSTPARTAAELGFAPWGNAGPGGDLADASAIVDAMRTAGYRLPADAPYSGPGSGTHGSTDQFLAACEFFPGKTR
jgi:hypothetical protein